MLEIQSEFSSLWRKGVIKSIRLSSFEGTSQKLYIWLTFIGPHLVVWLPCFGCQVFVSIWKKEGQTATMMAFAILSYLHLPLSSSPQKLALCFVWFQKWCMCVHLYIHVYISLLFIYCIQMLWNHIIDTVLHSFFLFNNVFWRSFLIAQVNYNLCSHSLTDTHLHVFNCLQWTFFTCIISHLYEAECMLL